MPIYLKVSAADTGGEQSIFIAEYKKDQGPPLHAHDVDETFYVLEGEHIFQVAGEHFRGKPGDIVFIPRNAPHTTLCLSEKGRLLFSVNPAGTIEQVFEKLDSLTGTPSAEEITSIHSNLGLSILGPPLSAENL